MDLETLVRCLADHYAWNDESGELHRLGAVLRKLAADVDSLAAEVEARKVRYNTPK